ncbi:tos1 [Trichoderma arundinaceum]|uniref:Tos1 n=1 Tax=Trichoderma arundinaceum TaxID=490622 RepID=A0A395NGU6_TRIAR|nr:tos1 [Trichoderma arundinaceum]
MIFLGNYGGQGSGVWDTIWGNSLSYLNAEGTGGTSAPQILKDVYIPSNKEFAIFSGEKCDESCGYSRATDVVYKGFAGANKVFLFNFKMPLDGNRDFNGDMSALWALNGRIPRTAQYSSCSCWMTGCGEADILEVLAPGDTKCKSTFHLASGAGSSDYFERPINAYLKVAMVFDEKTASVSIKQLPDDTDFSEGLDAETEKSWINGGEGQDSSIFQVS